MNILFFLKEDNAFMYQWQRMHIFNELEKNNHKVFTVNDALYGNVLEANEQLIRFIKYSKHKIDLFVTAVESKRIFKQTVQEIKGFGIPTLLICYDNLHDPYSQLNIAPLFDLVWLTSAETKNIYEKADCTTITLPYAANPFRFMPTFENEINSLCFVGSLYGTRLDKIKSLSKHRIACDIYSASHKKDNKSTIDKFYPTYNIHSVLNLLKFNIGHKILFGAVKSKLRLQQKIKPDKSLNFIHCDSLSFEKMIHTYSNHSLSLNITELRNTYLLKRPIHKLHLRTFEIPMCGGIQLSSYTPELSEYFEDGKEIVLYKTEEEMISKARFYLSDKQSTLRKKMRINARVRSLNEHTWTNRFNLVFKKINIQ